MYSASVCNNRMSAEWLLCSIFKICGEVIKLRGFGGTVFLCARDLETVQNTVCVLSVS